MKLHVEPFDDRGEWERFWGMHAPGALFQSWCWGEVVKKQSLPLVRFGLYERSRLIGIYQVMVVRARRGTYLHIRHGPVLERHTVMNWKSVLSHLCRVARLEGAWFLRFSPQIDDTPGNQKLFTALGLRPSITHEVDAERCLLLPIGQTEDALLAAMRKSTRYDIRRSEKMDIHVVHSTDPKDLEKFFELYRKTSKRQHFVEHEGVACEFEVYAKIGNVVLLMGYHEQTLMSAAIILFSGNQAIYHHGASIPSKAPVNYAVQWTAIRMAKERGYTWYNFWGVSPQDNLSHPWAGHSLFKRGFGGMETVKIHAQDYPVSRLYYFTRAFEWWQERRRGY
ncbi:MAG: peptidoglycan bridge formation glycyltransferase FemA/FemB family protein [Candidatus Gottesmanbacteria bacterium]|nr:peptidoglycan bridge formation glycyltransferase FemA/FemB family protein [Candidatus Gottesmanbacteria bacterium]